MLDHESRRPSRTEENRRAADIHIVEGELKPQHDRIIPGRQIVGEILAGAAGDLPLGTRVGVSWIAP
jgi:D-arabinose 1-dehydrogenase-like Zn-dependent alcohol dehydrogenase